MFLNSLLALSLPTPPFLFLAILLLFNWYAPGVILHNRTVALRVERVHEIGQEL